MLLKTLNGDRGFCSACFDGHHPFPLKAGGKGNA
jgi:hypothetical protein